MCVLRIVTYVSCLFILGVLSPWEFSGGPGHNFFCVSLRCVECRAGTILFRLSVGAVGGTVQIFFLSGSDVAGTVRLKWWGGGPSFSAFSSLLSVFLAVGCLR